MAIIGYDGSDAWINEPREDFDEGVYAAKLTGWGENKNSNHVLTLTVTDEGDYKGATIKKTIGSDLEKRGNKSALATALVALGMPREKALSPKVSIDTNKLIGKSLHFYTRPKAEGETYAPIDLLPPEAVQEMKARFAAMAQDVESDAAPTPKGGKAKNGVAAPQHAAPAAEEADPFA